MRKDNYAFFVDTQGKPKDYTFRVFSTKTENGHFGEMQIGDVKIIKYGKRFYVALCIKDSETNHVISTQNEIIKTVLHKFKRLIHEN